MYLGRIDNTPSYRKYLWLFFLAAAGFCLFIFDYTLSRVTIRIFPQNVTQTTSVSATLDQSASAPAYEKFAFPAGVVEKEVVVTGDTPSTGIKSEDGFASGEITITSKRDKDIPLPKGYKVIAGEGPVADEPWKNKIIFSLDNDIVIPAGGTITTTVTAINKGARGNIPAGPMYFSSMATWNRERLIPKATKPFTGGVAETKIIAEQDVSAAKDVLIKKAKTEAVQDCSSKAADGKECREELAYIFVDEFTTSHPIGEAATTFQAQIKGKARMLTLPASDIKEALKKKISSEYSASELLQIDEGSLTMSVASMDMESGKAQVEAKISGIFAPKFSSEVFDKSDLAGFNETAIRQKYASNPAIEKIEVKFFPLWRKTVPSLEDHVFVEIVK